MTVSTQVTRRVEYSGNASTTVFAYGFPIYVDADAVVNIVSALGVSTLKTITTHYTVSGAGGTSGGNITMVTAPASGETLVIESSLALKQSIDLVNNDTFDAETLETGLDRLTLQSQELKDAVGRSITLPTSAVGAVSTELPNPSASKAITWSADALSLVNGATFGIWKGNWATSTVYVTSDIVKDSSNSNVYIVLGNYTSGANVAADVSNSDLELVIDAAAAAASAAAAQSSEDDAAADLVLTNADVVTTTQDALDTAADVVLTNADVVSTAALLDSFDDRYLGAKGSAPSVDNDGNSLLTGALYFLTTTDQMFVYDGSAWDAIKPTTAEQSSINAVEADATDIGVVSGISANVTTVAGNSANVTTVAGISGNVTTVAGISGNTTTVAGISGNVTTVAGATANIGTVAGISANVTTVAGISADVTTAATNVTDITNFADVYLGPASSNPSTRIGGASLVSGDMYFNTTTDVMNTWNGSAWVAVSVGSASATAAGAVELLTTAEAITGTDTTRAMTAAAMHGALAGLADTTIVAGDAIVFSDASDSGALKEDTVQGILDLVPASDPAPGANLIINGGMTVSQRGTSFAAPALNSYTLDRWAWTVTATDAVFTVSQDTTGIFAAFGSDSCMKMDCTTIDASLATTAGTWLSTALEGQDFQHLKWGTANAEDLTLSFLFQSPKSGTHSVILEHADHSGGSAGYAIDFTVASADTPERITVTFPGDTVSGINNDTSEGMGLRFPIAIGTNYQIAPDGWVVGNDGGSTSSQNLADSTANNIYIGQVKLEVGSSATAFQHESYGDVLAKCQRYFWRAIDGSIGLGEGGFNVAYNATTAAYGIMPYKVTMRVEPTRSVSDAAHFEVVTSDAVFACSVISLVDNGINAQAISVTTSARTVGHGGYVRSKSLSATMDFSAEL